MAQDTVQHLGLRLPEAELGNGAPQRPPSPPATQDGTIQQPGARETQLDNPGEAEAQQAPHHAEIIQQQSAEIQRLRALLAQQPATAQEPEGRALHPGGLPRLFLDDDAAACARALATAATGAEHDNSKKVVLPAIVPGHKVNPLGLSE
jgi:hypothetical protein